MADGIIIELIAGLCLFATIIVLAPRLLFRPLLRDKLWRLRDEVSLARRAGALPYNHPAPLSLINRIEATLTYSDDMSLVKLIFAYPFLQRAPEEFSKHVAAQLNPDLSELTDEERALYLAFDRRCRVATVLMPFITWFGALAIVVGFVILLIVATGALVVGKRNPLRAGIKKQELTIEEITLERARLEGLMVVV